MSSIKSPEHYKTHEFECIDEMLLAFGEEAVINFCILNAWKYRYRAGSKGNAEEDLKKADEYMRFVYWLKGMPDLLKLKIDGEEISWGYDNMSSFKKVKEK